MSAEESVKPDDLKPVKIFDVNKDIAYRMGMIQGSRWIVQKIQELLKLADNDAVRAGIALSGMTSSKILEACHDEAWESVYKLFPEVKGSQSNYNPKTQMVEIREKSS